MQTDESVILNGNPAAGSVSVPKPQPQPQPGNTKMSEATEIRALTKLPAVRDQEMHVPLQTDKTVILNDNPAAGCASLPKPQPQRQPGNIKMSEATEI